MIKIALSTIATIVKELWISFKIENNLILNHNPYKEPRKSSILIVPIHSSPNIFLVDPKGLLQFIQ